MEQRVWVYKANDDSFWIAREPVFDHAVISAPTPILEIGSASIEPFELSPRTQEQLAYAGVAKLTRWDSDPVILRLEPTHLGAYVPRHRPHARR